VSGVNGARSRRIVLPLLVVIILAGGWIAYWYAATRFADHALDRLIAREAARGREISCEDRVQGGFPFRFEVSCLRPAVTWQTQDGPAHARLARIDGVVLAYNLSHAIFEMSGPFIAELPPRGPRLQHIRVEWGNARASLILDILGPPAPEDVAIVIDELKVWAGNDPDMSVPALLASAHTQINASRRADGGGPRPDFDLAVQADRVALRDPGNSSKQLADLVRFELLGALFEVPLMETANLNHFVALWQRNGGYVNVRRLWLDDGRSAVLADGRLALTPFGSIEGRADLAVAGAEAILARIGANPDSDSRIANIALGALSMIGKPVTIGGRQATKVPLVFRSGVVSIGGMVDIKLPPILPQPVS